MAIIKNTASQGLYVYAHDTAADAAKTGDAANITATISLDGAAAGATNDVNPTEIGGGVYWFALTQAETNAGALALVPVSATGDVVLDPIIVLTQEAVITYQSGDAYARLGAPAGASVSADIAAIEAQTDDIGVAGAGLTAVPWNAAWDAEVESECDDALNAYDPPTNAEMEARTLAAADYTVVSDLPSVPSAADIKTALEANGSKIDHLWEMTEDDGGTRRLTANALEQAPATGAAPTVEQIAAAILHTPANLLVTDANGYVSISGTKNTLDDLSGTDGDTLKTLSDQIDGVGGAAGPGAITFTYTLTSTEDGTAIPDAEVWVTARSTTTPVLASGRTNASGQVVFYLEAGLIDVWRRKSGWNFTNPDQEEVA